MEFKSKLNILHTVEFYPPSVGGMQEVVKQLSERLVRLGHNVTVATTKLTERTTSDINGVEIVEFDISGNLARGLQGETDAYKDFLLSSNFDVITNFAAQQWATDIMLPIMDKVKGKKVFVPTGFSGLHLKEYEDYFERMKAWLKQYDMSVFLSDDYRDIDFARDQDIRNTVLIPNGAGADEFTKAYDMDIRKLLGIPKEHFLVLHVGSHTGIKGHAEALQIFKKARIKNSAFLLIANTISWGGCAIKCHSTAKVYNSFSLNSRLLNKRIIVSELSREETVAAYHAADLFLFPSNIECSPLVLFESMAAKTPFLTTDVGNSKEIIKWSSAGRLLPTDKLENGYVRTRVTEAIKLLEEMYNSKSSREAMGLSGYQAWQERFTWEKITLRYEELYKRLVDA